MEDVAELTAATLEDHVGPENVVGVSYYDRNGVGHVYRSDWATEKYDPDQVDAIVEELRFESLSHAVHEGHQDESLHATVRIYDEMLDVAVPTNDNRGVVFALDADGDYAVRDVVDAVETTLESTDATATAEDE